MGRAAHVTAVSDRGKIGVRVRFSLHLRSAIFPTALEAARAAAGSCAVASADGRANAAPHFGASPPQSAWRSARCPGSTRCLTRRWWRRAARRPSRFRARRETARGTRHGASLHRGRASDKPPDRWPEVDPSIGVRAEARPAIITRMPDHAGAHRIQLEAWVF